MYIIDFDNLLFDEKNQFWNINRIQLTNSDNINNYTIYNIIDEKKLIQILNSIIDINYKNIYIIDIIDIDFQISVFQLSIYYYWNYFHYNIFGLLYYFIDIL